MLKSYSMQPSLRPSLHDLWRGETMTPTRIDTAAIEARLKAATPGPWQADAWLRILRLMFEKDAEADINLIPALVDWPPKQAIADATFIAHARADIAALLAERKRLGEALREFCMKTHADPTGVFEECLFCTAFGPAYRFEHKPGCVLSADRAAEEG